MQVARTALRSSIERIATTTGITAALRRAHPDRVAVVAYHNVVQPDDTGIGDTSLHLPLPRFIRQIERLARTHDIVDLDSALTPPAQRADPRHGDRRGLRHRHHRPRAVITFDDAYRGAVTLALPELIRRGLPATVFVAPALLDQPATWWDTLGAAGLLSNERRDTALNEQHGRTELILRDAPDSTPARLPDSYGIASLAELQRHCADAITVGSHSWAHEHLPSLTVAELNDSLGRTRAWLDAYDGPTSRWLALPYGAGSDTVTRTALDLGHTGVLRITGGLWHPSGDPTSVPRINIPAGMNHRGMELRTSGLLGRPR